MATLADIQNPFIEPATSEPATSKPPQQSSVTLGYGRSMTGTTVGAPNPPLGALSHLELDPAIPPELYEAVAEVFAWVCRLDARAG